MLIRQGDVALVPTSAMVDGVAGRVVLVRGISTGHAHVLTQAVERPGTPRVVCVHSGCELVHPEHATIAVPPGAYTVVRQIEGDDSMVED